MKKILFCILMFPFFVFADDETEAINKLEKLKFENGVMAATYCHNYYAFGKLLFELNEKGDPKNSIPRIREQFGDEFTDSILNFAENEKDTMKQNQFLNKRYKECIERTIATGEQQKP